MSLAIVPMEGRHLNELAEISRLCFSMPWSRDGTARGIHHPGGAGVECARDCPV